MLAANIGKPGRERLTFQRIYEALRLKGVNRPGLRMTTGVEN